MNTLFFLSRPLPLTHALTILALTSLVAALLTIAQWTPIICTTLFALSMFLFQKKHYSLIPLLFGMTLVSLTTVARIWQQHASYAIHQELLNQPVTIRATIAGIQHSNMLCEQCTLTLKTKSIQTKKKTTYKNLCIKIFAHPHQIKKLALEQEIELKNIFLSKPAPQSDFETYLIKEGIWATAKTNSYHQITIIKNTYSHKHNFLDQLQRSFSEKTKLLFHALFLGQKEKNKQLLYVQHTSMYWGISHMMARSGIHLVVLFSLFMFFFHYVQLRHRSRYLIAILIFAGYFYISISSISFLRALCMLLVHILGWLTENQTSSLHAASLILLGTILHNPFQALFLDFQLSFGITYIIIWLFIFKKR